MQRTVKIAYPNEIYDVELERKLLTEHHIQETILEISRLSLSSGAATLDLLLEITSSRLQNALFGCAVDVGICTDSNNKVLEFYERKAYARTLYRGESASFKSMDRREIVMEVKKMNTISHVHLYVMRTALFVVRWMPCRTSWFMFH